ncbi:MAG: hypothetical protein IT377_09585 [Polyangiaceae bacterium]|nr:hypothetical protein [Myxococcales bacterium]MCC6899214.1 hypothetical protein [Polyangiaceae bacterium]
MGLLGGALCLGVIAVPIILWLLVSAFARQEADRESQNALRYFKQRQEQAACTDTTTLDFATMTLRGERIWNDGDDPREVEVRLVRRKGDGTWESKPTPETWTHLQKEAHGHLASMFDELKARGEESLKSLGDGPTWTALDGDFAAAVEPRYQSFVAQWRGRV